MQTLSDTALRVVYECVAEIFLNDGKFFFEIWLLCKVPAGNKAYITHFLMSAKTNSAVLD